MNAIRILKHLDSENLQLPDLRPLIGKDVEIIVLENGVAKADMTPSGNECPLRGSVLVYEDPFEPVAETDWEALQ